MTILDIRPIARIAANEFKFDPNSTENEGRWRLIDPKAFNQETIRRWKRWKGIQTSDIQYVMGMDTRDKKWKPQAIRFDKGSWTEDAASKWWDEYKNEFEKEWTQADWDQWILKHPNEVFVEDNIREADLQSDSDDLFSGKITMEEFEKLHPSEELPDELPKTFDILQCAWCGKYMDKEGNYVDAPEDTRFMSHGICPLCKERVLEEIDNIEEQKPEIKSTETIPDIEEINEAMNIIHNNTINIDEAAQAIYKKWGFDVGKVTTHIVGGRAKGTPLKEGSDIDLYLQIEKPLKYNEDNMDNINPAMEEILDFIWSLHPKVRELVHVLEFRGRGEPAGIRLGMIRLAVNRRDFFDFYGLAFLPNANENFDVMLDRTKAIYNLGKQYTTDIAPIIEKEFKKFVPMSGIYGMSEKEVDSFRGKVSEDTFRLLRSLVYTADNVVLTEEEISDIDPNHIWLPEQSTKAGSLVRRLQNEWAGLWQEYGDILTDKSIDNEVKGKVLGQIDGIETIMSDIGDLISKETLTQIKDSNIPAQDYPTLFRELPWVSSYGGESWANIADRYLDVSRNTSYVDKMLKQDATDTNIAQALDNKDFETTLDNLAVGIDKVNSSMHNTSALAELVELWMLYGLTAVSAGVDTPVTLKEMSPKVAKEVVESYRTLQRTEPEKFYQDFMNRFWQLPTASQGRTIAYIEDPELAKYVYNALEEQVGNEDIGQKDLKTLMYILESTEAYGGHGIGAEEPITEPTIADTMVLYRPDEEQPYIVFLNGIFENEVTYDRAEDVIQALQEFGLSKDESEDKVTDAFNESLSDTDQEEPPLEVDAFLLEAISGYCDICGKYSTHLEKHRVKRGYEGGEYVPENIQLLCPKDHKKVHSEAGEYQMGGEWKHKNLRKELGEEGYSKWQAKRGKEKQKKVRKELGEEGYSKKQREIALQRWHPNKKKKQKNSVRELTARAKLLEECIILESNAYDLPVEPDLGVTVAEYIYDPDKSLLLNTSGNPMEEEGKPTDYPDPAYWGYPETLMEKRKLKKFRYKRESSVLDYPKNSLDPLIWYYEEGNDLPKLQQTVKETIISKFIEWTKGQGIDVSPDLWLKTFLLIGSTATTQWKETSDIDIDVIIDEDILSSTISIGNAIASWLGIRAASTLNGYKVGEHPVNYWVRSDDQPIESADAIYDLSKDLWIKPPPNVPKEYDPEALFRAAWDKAKAWAINFDTSFGEIKRLADDYIELQENLITTPEELEESVIARINRKGIELDLSIKSLLDDYMAIALKRRQVFESTEKDLQQQDRLYFSRNWADAALVYKWLEKYKYINLIKEIYHIYKSEPEGMITIDKIRQLAEVLS